jgi:hypothetical protein
MSEIWDIERLKAATTGERIGQYEGIPATAREEAIKKSHPHTFSFQAVSIGDSGGQAFLVPLDESSEATAKLILRAIAAYEGD